MLRRFSRVQLFVTLWTVAHQTPLSMAFPGKNTGVGCHLLLQGMFPTQGMHPHFLCLLHCRRVLYHYTAWEALPSPLTVGVVLFLSASLYVCDALMSPRVEITRQINNQEVQILFPVSKLLAFRNLEFLLESSLAWT